MLTRANPVPSWLRRNFLLIIVTGLLVALLAVLGMVFLVIKALQDGPAIGPGGQQPGGQQPGGRPAATGTPAAAAPPTNIRLRDDTTTITVSWQDPSAGTVPFVVAGGRAGQTLGAMATVDPGRTSYTVNGLNPRVDYCFTVLAVYSTESYATSGQACTKRSVTSSPR